MRTYRFLFLAILPLALAFASPSQGAEKPRQEQSSKAKKLWTNEDMESLRARGLITTFSQVPNTTAQAPAASSEPVTFESRLEDPAWYAEEASFLQAELDRRQAALSEAQLALAQAAKGITEPGIDMGKGNPGVTPESGIDLLQAQAREIQSQLDELSDLARQNNIPPGVLRG